MKPGYGTGRAVPQACHHVPPSPLGSWAHGLCLALGATRVSRSQPASLTLASCECCFLPLCPLTSGGRYGSRAEGWAVLLASYNNGFLEFIPFPKEPGISQSFELFASKLRYNSLLETSLENPSKSAKKRDLKTTVQGEALQTVSSPAFLPAASSQKHTLPRGFVQAGCASPGCADSGQSKRFRKRPCPN